MCKMKYSNPIIRGFYPDPSMCRAGDMYYMVCSSMQVFPGVPLFESKDMVNWTQIGHCLTRPSQIALDGVRSSGGVFAPTIRYNDGRFYMVTTNDSTQENFYVYTDDIHGEWSEPVPVDQDGIDPSLFFEDGHSYFISNGSDENGIGSIQMCEIEIETGRKLSESKILWQGTGGRFLEAPHMYKFGDYYYLLEAEGGTEYGHMTNYSRSKNLWGPFESYPGNPVLTNRNLGGYPIQAVGHGDIVEDAHGNWWFAHLAFRQIDAWLTFHHLGREVCLVPLHWREDGWFEIGVNGTTPTEVELPDSISFAPQNFSYDKTFENLSQETDWCYLRIPSMENYRFEKDSVALHGTSVTLEDVASPTFAAIRQTEFFEDITVDVIPGEQTSGICFYMDENHHYEIRIDKAGQTTAVYSRQKIGVIHQDSEKIEIHSDQVHLHIVADNLQYHFYVTDDNGKEVFLSDAETRYLSTEVAGGFTGTLIGLFAIAGSAKDAWSTFKNLHVKHTENPS